MRGKLEDLKVQAEEEDEGADDELYDNVVSPEATMTEACGSDSKESQLC